MCVYVKDADDERKKEKGEKKGGNMRKIMPGYTYTQTPASGNEAVIVAVLSIL